MLIRNLEEKILAINRSNLQRLQKRRKICIFKSLSFTIFTDGFDELPDEKKKKILREKEEFKNRSFEVSQGKLIRLHEKCGFRLIDGEKEFMVADLFEKYY